MKFKMQQIHLRPGLRPIHTLGSPPHSLVSWDLVQGEAAGRTFAPGAADPRAATGPVGSLVAVHVVFTHEAIFTITNRSR